MPMQQPLASYHENKRSGSILPSSRVQVIGPRTHRVLRPIRLKSAASLCSVLLVGGDLNA